MEILLLCLYYKTWDYFQLSNPAMTGPVLM
jgi:hypothetical protein